MKQQLGIFSWWPKCWVFGLGVFILACGGRFKAECTLHGGQDWAQFESPHFRLYTNSGSKAGRRAVEQLEWTRGALLLMWNEQLQPKTRIEVIMLKNRAQLEEFEPDGFEGKMALPPRGPTMVLYGSSITAVPAQRRVIAHEMTHYLSSFVFPVQPLWFAEGLAQFMETVDMGLEKQSAQFGHPSETIIHYLGAVGPHTLEELWKWNTYRLPKQTIQHLYASSALWFHFLYNRHEARFTRFWTLAASGTDPQKSWNEAFAGVNDADLFKELKKYLFGGEYVSMEYAFQPQPVSIDESPMSPAQVHLLRARLFSMAGRLTKEERKKNRLQELKTAVSIDPNSVDGRALLIMAESEPKKQLAEAKALVKQFPNEGSAHNALITALRANSPKADITDELEQALKYDPENPYLNAELAVAYAGKRREARAAMHIEKALHVAPWNADIIAHHAVVKALFGNCRYAGELLKQAQSIAVKVGGKPSDGLNRYVMPFIDACNTQTAIPHRPRPAQSAA